MKRKLLLQIVAVVSAILGHHASAQWVVADPTLIAQMTVNNNLTLGQQQLLRNIRDQIGNPSTVRSVAGASAVIDSLGAGSGGSPSTAGSTAASPGESALFAAITQRIVKPDGTTVDRNAEDYRKFEAAHSAAAKYQAVLSETESRRKTLLEGIAATTKAIQNARDLATVQKLQAVSSSQIAALNAIDGERSAALGAVMVQSLDNETDKAKQEQARVEERSVDFRTATEQFTQFLTPIAVLATTIDNLRR